MPAATPVLDRLRRWVAACTPRGLLLAAIRFYKRRVSPRKGWSCAHRVHTGRCSCSSFGLRVIARRGAWRGLGLLRWRLAKCGAMARRHRGSAARPRLRAAQAGFIDCDVPCDASCVPDAACSAIGDTLSVTDCCDCGGCDPGWDWPRRRRRKGSESEPHVWEPGPGG